MNPTSYMSVYGRTALIVCSFLTVACSANKDLSKDSCEIGEHNIDISSSASLSPYLDRTSSGDKKNLTADQLGEQLDEQWAVSIDLNRIESSDSVVARSCTDILESEGPLEPIKPSEFSAYQLLNGQCQAAALISNARPSTRSCINDLVFDSSLPEKLPKDLAFVASTSEKDRILSDGSIFSWSDAQEIQSVEASDAGDLVISVPGGKQVVTLMATADFNADGVEDILLRVANEVEAGSYSHTIFYALTKTGAGEDYRVINALE